MRNLCLFNIGFTGALGVVDLVLGQYAWAAVQFGLCAFSILACPAKEEEKK